MKGELPAPGGVRIHPHRQSRFVIHSSAWKGGSQKFISRTVHKAPVLRRIRPLRTLKAQKPDYYISLTGIRCARVHARYRIRTLIRGRGSQELRPRVCYERYGLPDMGVSTRRFKGRYIWSGPRAVEDPRRGFNGV